MKEKLIREKSFPYKHFTTAKSCGNMKNAAELNALLRSLRLCERKLVLANQVHGIRVRTVAPGGQNIISACDGLITADKNIMLGIFTADCMPVLMYSDDGSVKAAVHAGWKGLAAGILRETVKLFKENFNIPPESIAAYIGPHIRECCYEVSPEFEKIFGVRLNGGKLDMSAIAGKTLAEQGLRKIFVSGHCSCCEGELFFSYRRDKTEKRMITIAL